MIVWCVTGGGDFFDDNHKLILQLLSKNHPILVVFSNAGAVVYNRYGFFWNLTRSNIEFTNSYFLFESQYVLEYNISDLLKKTGVVYSALPRDPTFASGVWLANQEIKCIIVSPLTSNSVAKLILGINDSLILNLLSAGKKANQLIGILPTDRGSNTITTKLPVRQNKIFKLEDYDPKVCMFRALDSTTYSTIYYLPEYCVGCRKCVEKYPHHFTVDEKLEIHIRPIDQQNTQRLSDEFRVFYSVEEISIFISSL